jgi:hypothetical protein
MNISKKGVRDTFSAPGTGSAVRQTSWGEGAEELLLNGTNDFESAVRIESPVKSRGGPLYLAARVMDMEVESFATLAAKPLLTVVGFKPTRL